MTNIEIIPNVHAIFKKIKIKIPDMRRDLKPNAMNNQFIVLTTTENTEIIIGLNTIATIRVAPGNPNMTAITFNFTKDNDLQPYYIVVKEEFGLVKSMLKLENKAMKFSGFNA